MTPLRDDFEHRLNQGLKRWAEAGEPTLDLEAAVCAQAGESAPELPRRTRTWVRWLSLAASLIVVVGGLFVSFPVWAGTAAGWPVIGPAVREIIMKDAGLKWAYDAGLMGTTLAEATDGGVTVRILGVAADKASTTILYQITGFAGTDPATAKPQPVTDDGLWSRLAHPADTYPVLRIRKLPGSLSLFSSWAPPVQTPIGLVGTLSSNPMGAETGPVELEVEVNGHRLTLSFVASRSAADRFSKEIPVHQSQTIAGITYNIESVIQTPVQTVVRYQEIMPVPTGSFTSAGRQTGMFLESGGKSLPGSKYYNDQDFHYVVFPRANLPARLVLPETAAGETRQLTWPLATGAVQEVESNAITLTEWDIRDHQLAASWTYMQGERFLSFDQFEVLDAAGTAFPVSSPTSSHMTGNVEQNLPLVDTYRFDLPPGVTPVAIRSQRITVVVPGPWTFDLPAK